MNKSASILFEIILSIFLLSIVSVSAILIYKDFFAIQHNEYSKELTNIELLNTKYFLQKNINQANLHLLNYEKQTLYFEKAILLNNVNTFMYTKKAGYINFSICVQNKRCKTFEIKQ